jgi:hypothetical protein
MLDDQWVGARRCRNDSHQQQRNRKLAPSADHPVAQDTSEKSARTLIEPQCY